MSLAGFGAITENYPPFQSPLAMGMACSCFLPGSSVFNCSVPADNGRHPSAGKGCSIDTVAGGIWFQRIKQLLLSNGIAVVVLNPYYFDGWNAYTSVWTHGFDQPVMRRLADEMAGPAGVFRGKLDPARIALHGWSGGAQMVSWSINMQVRQHRHLFHSTFAKHPALPSNRPRGCIWLGTPASCILIGAHDPMLCPVHVKRPRASCQGCRSRPA